MVVASLNWRALMGILALEFFERLAYYSTVFTFTTFSVTMLQYSVSQGNALLQGFWALTPLAALVAAVITDILGTRVLTIAAFVTVYGIALALIATASSPLEAMFTQFPEGVTWLSEVIFLFGVVLLAIGYGGMKSSCAALMADSAFAIRVPLQQPVDDVVIRASTKSEGELAPVAAAAERGRLSSLFRWYYWAFNCGALVGTLCSPFLLLVDPRTIPGQSNGNQVSGYYAVYWMSTAATLVGLLFFLAQRRQYAPAAATAQFVPFLKALCLQCGQRWKRLRSKPLVAEGPEEKLLVDAAAEKHQRDLHAVGCVRRTLTMFSVLPVYWLVGNQYGSNLMLQASWLELPSGFQPELFMNVNTIATLVFLPVFDRIIMPLIQPRGGHFSPTRRMILGFAAAVVGLVWCAGLQIAIQARGYVDDQANYTLYPEHEVLSAAWILPPFVLQGVASALVDTTAIETGYLMAPDSMKSTVHTLYLLCSSASGFLGLLIAPVMTPRSFVPAFFSLSLTLAIAAAVFGVLGPRVECEAFADNGPQATITVS